MTTHVSVVADSTNPWGGRLTTFLLRYPLCIHAEFMTHREISRNAASSRAIPVIRMMVATKADPFVPQYWLKNLPGMQGVEPIDDDATQRALKAWNLALGHALEAAHTLQQLGVHKQVVNRLLAPFAHITVLATASNWSNFFGLRCHEAAEPHMRDMARTMRRAYLHSQPTYLRQGEWHMPLVTPAERANDIIGDQLVLSVARCASTSYTTVDDLPMDMERAQRIYDKLITERPMHASPLEHQAYADRESGPKSGNFEPGWTQYRKTLAEEYIDDEVLHVLETRPAWSNDRPKHRVDTTGGVRPKEQDH